MKKISLKRQQKNKNADEAAGKEKERKARKDLKAGSDRKKSKDRKDAKGRRLLFGVGRSGKRFARKGAGIAAAAGKGAEAQAADPMLHVAESSKNAALKSALIPDIACAVLLMAALGLFCVSIYAPEHILFALSAAVVFLIISLIEAVKPGGWRWIAAGVTAVILLATAIIWRQSILSGLGMLANQFYDIAEEAQAYLYDRFMIGYDASEFDEQVGLAWASALIGLIAALPPMRFRRGVCVLIVSAVMLALAYYGLIPSAVCVAVMLAALIAAVSRGGIIPAASVILASLIVFGAIVLIDPGENYAISRVDENLRDRLALRSALIESSLYEDESEDEWDEEDDEDTEDEEDTDDGSFLDGKYGTVAVIVICAAAAALIAAAIYLTHRRLSKKRKNNRKGINSRDSKEAVAAMFPYAVRWLRGYGIDKDGASFTSIIPALKGEFSESYIKRYSDMYMIWSEAAYSDHDVSEDSRILMERFMKDTIDQIKEKCKLKDKLRFRFRYAL